MNNRLIKKIIVIVLALAMLFSTVSAGAAENYGTAEDSQTTVDNSGTGIIDNNSIEEIAAYHEVSFDYSEKDGEAAAETITLPEKCMVEDGTLISTLDIPEKNGCVFVGWYYDKECTLMATNLDKVDKDMTLYPRFSEANGSDGEFTINYVSDLEVNEDYTVELVSYGLDAGEISENLAARNMSLGGEAIEVVLEDITEEPEEFNIDEAGLAEELLLVVKDHISKEEEDSSYSLYENLMDLGLEEELLEAILDKYAPDELEENYLEIVLSDVDPSVYEAMKSEEIDFRYATTKDLKEHYGLAEEESLGEYWEENLGYGAQDILAMTDILARNELKAKEETGRFLVKPASGLWDEGDLLQIEILSTEKLRFVFQGEITAEAIIYYNFSVYHEQEFNLTINNGVIFIPVNEVEGIEISEGIFDVSLDNESVSGEEREDSGLMTYSFMSMNGMRVL